MFGTEIEFFGILGTGCFSTARSFLSSLDWLVPFLFLFFLFLFFTRCSCKWNDWGCFQVACLRLLLQHEQAARVDGWMDSSRRDYRVFLLYSTVYRPQRRLILHVTYCLPMYLRSVSRVMGRTCM